MMVQRVAATRSMALFCRPMPLPPEQQMLISYYRGLEQRIQSLFHLYPFAFVGHTYVVSCRTFVLMLDSLRNQFLRKATTMIEFATEAGKANGYLALPSGSTGPGVLVLHAWWGLNDFFKQQC